MPSCPVSCIKRHPIHPASHNPSPGTGSPRASIVQAVQKDFLQPSPPTLQHAPFKQHANHTSASKRHANHNPACKPHTNHTPASKPHANHICASKPSSSRPALQFGRLRHVGRYAKDPWCALNLFTNLLLLVLSATTLVLYAADEEVQAERRDRWINIAFCSAGVLVWVRLLQLVVPVYHSLGPLLTTTAAMVSEVVAFVFPYIVVLSGFATLMTGVYADSVTGYSSWIESMLTLFAAMLGDFSFDAFEVDKTTGDAMPGHMTIFGQVVLVLYLVMVAILLLNLLLAIMLNRYKPEEAEGQSQFKQAQVVDYYQQQVEQTYMCGPLNLLHCLLFWLPKPPRSLQRSHRTEALMLVNPDGEVLPEMINNPEFDLLAGRGEFPHFVFLLTVYPLLSLAAVGGYILCLPFAVLQFSANVWESFFKVSGCLRTLPAVAGVASADPQPPRLSWPGQAWPQQTRTLPDSAGWNARSISKRTCRWVRPPGRRSIACTRTMVAVHGLHSSPLRAGLRTLASTCWASLLPCACWASPPCLKVLSFTDCLLNPHAHVCMRLQQWVKRMDSRQVHPAGAKLAPVSGRAAKLAKKAMKSHSGAGKLGRQLDRREDLSWQRTTGALLL